ncbi:MAG: D-alanyl-D-alanine carboxypeptidase/D-alanyl-D-alanine-endopeptidase [Rubellimicrobium sp.]|nr:D-alanyl-D-alanine carboxypeptidase/D-alanyl-D-alanine-endopeptidase [Rubellimicrobium sp.]
MSGPAGRRHFLAGAVSLVATSLLAEAPARGLRPQARPRPAAGLRPRARPESILPPDAAAIIARSGLSGVVSVALADQATGAMLDAVAPTLSLPPASVMKAFTAFYAREVLGPDHRFATRLIGTGSISGGRLSGDLILAGGGDPTLVTDDLAALVRDLRAGGLREVAGRFLVWGGALPELHEIDPDQLPQQGYNPALGGLNLNFNRVNLEWVRAGGGWRLSMDARSETLRPEVGVIRATLAERAAPVFTHDDSGALEEWTVARSALGEGGSRWLPVRRPALYAGDVLRTLALAEGIRLPAAETVAVLPAGRELARHDSAPLDAVVAGMLDHSTNLTAEVLGLAAARASGGDPATLAQSAGMMRRWLRHRLGVAPRPVDHSGLGEGSSVDASAMLAALVSAGHDPGFAPLLKRIRLLDDRGEPLRAPPAEVRAKTGTLDFVSSLAGFITTPGGRRLAFAIFTADPAARRGARASDDEVPPGSREWNRAARRLQQQLVQAWALRHA